ncbi:MAG: hypothetical protein ILP11_01750 [Alphaproteobacteria bacterium]|nr:hypothetical protein [Alphaproteobacteria bacterium]
MISSQTPENTPQIVYIRKDVINNRLVWTLREEHGELLAYSEDKAALETAVDENYTLVTTH